MCMNMLSFQSYRLLRHVLGGLLSGRWILKGEDTRFRASALAELDMTREEHTSRISVVSRPPALANLLSSFREERVRRDTISVEASSGL
jgi:hypothetical protein